MSPREKKKKNTTEFTYFTFDLHRLEDKKKTPLYSLLYPPYKNLWLVGIKQTEHPAWGAEREGSVASNFSEQLDSTQNLHRI